MPVNKIRERYQRFWRLVAAAVIRCDSTTVYDNSGLKGPRIVAQVNEGFCIGSPTWPAGRLTTCGQLARRTAA
jgi:predicted ABC-type ATPase